MNVVLYTRVSTEEQVKGYSLSYQEDLCKEYCRKNGWNVVQVFQERGESAKTANRPQLLKLLDYARTNKGKFDMVLVHKLDRVARNAADHHGIRAALCRYNVVLRSVTEPIDESSQGRFMENIYAAVAQLDNDVRAERTREGLREKVKQGYWAWKAPIGYRNTPSGMVIDEPKAELIKRAFELFAQGGYTMNDIMHKLNRWGLRTDKGAKMHPQMVNSIFHNKLYMGVIEVKRWNYEGIGAHEKIVTPELFQKVQCVIQGKSFTAVPRLVQNPEFPLKNIVKCAGCGHTLTGSWSKGRIKRYAYYHCLCGQTRVAKAYLEKLFYESLKDIQPNEKFIALFKAIMVEVWEKKQTEVSNTVSRLTTEIAKLKETKQILIDKNLAGVFNDDDFKLANERITNEISVKEVERSEIRVSETDVQYLLSAAEALFRHVATIWLDAPIEDKLRFQHLIFPDGVIYENKRFGTATLGLPFALVPISEVHKNDLVPRAGFEPAILWLKTRCPRPLDERGIPTVFRILPKFIPGGNVLYDTATKEWPDWFIGFFKDAIQLSGRTHEFLESALGIAKVLRNQGTDEARRLYETARGNLIIYRTHPTVPGERHSTQLARMLDDHDYHPSLREEIRRRVNLSD